MMDEQKVKPKSMTVPDAGWEYLGLGKQAAYKAAKEGVIPTIKVGRLLRVPIKLMEEMLENPKRSEVA
jgi:excisionase family DNA binding protein